MNRRLTLVRNIKTPGSQQKNRRKKVSDFDFFDYASQTPEEAIESISSSLQTLLGEPEEAPKKKQGKAPARRRKDQRISMPFMSEPISTIWNWSDLDYALSNDEPNINLTVMSLILATNIECTIGKNAWSLVESNLSQLGFDHIVHYYFEEAEDVSCAAMVFARSKKPVHGKYVVAAIFRGTSSYADVLSDIKSQLVDGFYEAGMEATDKLRAYIHSQNLTKENTTLFITGHSYGAANASLVGILSTDLAERDSVFCYPIAAPNYYRDGRTGKNMKMFTFNSTEDIVPQVPVGPTLDKTGVEIVYNRHDIRKNHPEQYQRFLRVYKYFRHRDYDKDFDFMSEAYTITSSSKEASEDTRVDDDLFRIHMTYTYIALILSEQPDEVIDSYIGESEDPVTEIEMYAGEIYRLPVTGTSEAITWSSSDESVATLNEKGMLAAKGPGKTTLTGSLENGNKTTIEVTVLED